jgi:hypothetical protein
VAGNFVDELLGLHVLLDKDLDEEDGLVILLFVVPKEGQEGEWQVIANMR